MRPIAFLRLFVAPSLLTLLLTRPALAEPVGSEVAHAALDTREPPPPLPAETVRLPNGLRVFLAPDPSANLVSVRVRYAVGMGDDPAGLRGLAHLTEHLVAAETKHVHAALSALSSLGAAAYNATTDLDDTTYFETIPPERLEAILWLESDRMGFASEAVTPERLRTERVNVANEYTQRTVDAALGSFREITMPELFPGGHPYGDASGAADVDRIAVADVRAFLATWYQPSNATLIIAGRFDRRAALAAVTRYFASLPSAPPPTRPRSPEPHGRSVQLVVRAAVTTSSVHLEWRTPALGTADDAALDIVARALGGTGNERLTRALITTRLATGFNANEHSFRAASVFRIEAQVFPGADPGTVLSAIDDTVRSFAETARPTEIARAKEILRYEAFRRLETTWGRLSVLDSVAELGRDAGPGFDWELGYYDALGEVEIARAAAKWLVHGPRLVATVLKDTSAPWSGKLVQRAELAATREEVGQ